MIDESGTKHEVTVDAATGTVLAKRPDAELGEPPVGQIISLWYNVPSGWL